MWIARDACLTGLLGLLIAHLNPCIADVADFLTVEPLPFALIEAFGEGQDVLWLHHIDEGIANIAFVLEVYGQVEEVVQAVELLINSLQQHLLGVLIWDVLDHERGPCILACSKAEFYTDANVIVYSNGTQQSPQPHTLQTSFKLNLRERAPEKLSQRWKV